VKRYWEIIADKLSKAVGVWAGSQPSIPKDERCGLLMHTAMMAKGLSFGQIKCCQHFLSLRGSRTSWRTRFLAMTVTEIGPMLAL
jgi:hypothetical protein